MKHEASQVRIEGLNNHMLTFHSLTNIYECNDHYAVTVEAAGLNATRQVVNVMQSSRPVDYFKDLATHWREWTGEKVWESLEREFCLRASTDLTGHVHFYVELNTDNGLEKYAWKTSTLIIVDIGQFEHLADELHVFFN